MCRRDMLCFAWVSVTMGSQFPTTGKEEVGKEAGEL